MNKLEAIAQTQKRFTNLMDGKVIPSASVIDIIIYYEHLIDSNPAEVKYMSNIERNFEEQYIEEQLSEADYWDNDESNNFLQ
jgi:hypothetical protein